MRQFLPENYRSASEEELLTRTRAVKDKLGPDLVILAHHYERQEIVDLGDFSGDSFGLSKQAAASQARFIVFCGVHFMAESAAILARDGQAVFTPALEAGCPMANMASVEQVEKAWADLGRVVDLAQVTPITYVNSSAAVKAFCGAHGGATCTSSNADKLFAWALKERERILFLPDEHLGRNTAHKLNVGPVEMWDPDRENGGLENEKIEASKIIVWKGFCHVHAHFTTEMIEKRRAEHPGALVAVHPECPREVVSAADFAGSTEGIIKFVAAAAPGSAIVIGTEINLVERLARKHEGEKTVVPLDRSLCPNMFKINLHNLCWVLESLGDDRSRWVNQVTVTPEVKRDGGLALRRMLDIAG